MTRLIQPIAIGLVFFAITFEGLLKACAGSLPQ